MGKCSTCGKAVKGWFKHCFECNEKVKQKLTCEKCDVEVPEGHTLCITHWKEKQDKLNGSFHDKFEGKFYFNGMRVKSKSELLLLYFFEANGLYPPFEDLIM